MLVFLFEADDKSDGRLFFEYIGWLFIPLLFK